MEDHSYEQYDDEYSQEQAKAKKKVVSAFDKIAIILVLGILFYIISNKQGCEMVTKEEKIEWIDEKK